MHLKENARGLGAGPSSVELVFVFPIDSVPDPEAFLFRLNPPESLLG